MRIIDASQMNVRVAALNHHALVEQHVDAHSLQSWHHADRVVVAQHAIDRTA